MSKFLRTMLLAAMALSATALTVEAQSTKRFGILGGVDFATFTGSSASGFFISDPTGTVTFTNKSSTTGFIGGIFVDIPAGTSLTIEPELLYANKGPKYLATLYDDLGNPVGSGELTANIDYIMIPVLLKYNFQATGGPYALLGPAVSFNVGCSLKGSGGSADCSNDLGLETSTTFGGIVGLGYQKSSLGVEVRYDFDFGNTFSNVDGLKNAAWEILLRYQFK